MSYTTGRIRGQMMRAGQRRVDCIVLRNVTIVRETEKAQLLRFKIHAWRESVRDEPEDIDVETWFPASMTYSGGNVGDVNAVLVNAFFAGKKEQELAEKMKLARVSLARGVDVVAKSFTNP